MRDVQLFIDSYLSQFDLYKNLSNILETYNKSPNNYQSENKSLEEVQSRVLFERFVELATVIDSFEGWGEKEWTNFLMCMTSAYVEKGKVSAISCALAALGIQLADIDKPVTFENIYDEVKGEVVSKVIINIAVLNTPAVEKLNDELKDCLKHLVWLHKNNSSDMKVEESYVEVTLRAEYSKVVYSHLYCYSKISEYTTIQED